ncbi:FAD-dependent oxidoreductase [Candidatus Roizmanbacteria bacterium]|nr:FAD-dependent oxidoreductase [Candidatus Roizmanbacteria bacterium]
MKIAILGGGFTALSAAYYLQQKGHSVIILEKDKMLGGLSSGFIAPSWKWSLERTYHHIFESDNAIRQLAEEVGFNGVFFRSPQTASFYKTALKKDNYRIIPVDTPQDFLRFPLLGIIDRLRAAIVLAILKFGPLLPVYEANPAAELVSTFMGKKAWNILFQELFRKKFGKYAGKIVGSFMWARIRSRTKILGYVEGGFQAFIDHLEYYLTAHGVEILKEREVDRIEEGRNTIKLRVKRGESAATIIQADKVISTLPTPVFLTLTNNLFPSVYRKQLESLRYLFAVNLIIESDQPLLEKTYWLSICVPEMPLMVIVQHTNFVGKEFYGNKHIIYVGNYVDAGDPLLRINSEQMAKKYMSYLRKINPQFELSNSRLFLFKAPFAQPVFDQEFVKNRPSFITPNPNIFIANLDMTYPYDRGTNHAVRLGKMVSEVI